MPQDPMSEQPPVPIPGMPQGIDKRQLLAKLLTSMAPSGMPQDGFPDGGGTSARVGGPPPQMQSGTTPSGMPIPGLAPMSAAQAGGPMARNPLQQQGDPGREFRSPRARDAAVVANTMTGISNAVVKFKQQKFEKEAAQTAQITTTLMQNHIIQDKVNRGEAITPQDLEVAAQASKMDPKVMKLFEKAMKDPMSGAYVGIQRAQQQMQANIQAQAEVDYKRAQAEELRKRGQYYETLNPTRKDIADTQAGAKADALKAKQIADQNKLVSQNEAKGIHTEFDEQGRAITRPFTQDEIDADPMKKTLQAKEKALTEQAIARVRQGDAKLAIERAKLGIQRQLLQLKREHQQATDTGAPKLNSMEWNRIDMANIGHQQLSEMKDIISRRPDLFGTSGFFGTKFAKAYGNMDPDAMRFAVLAETSALPMVGMHARNAAMVRDMKDLNSSFYQNPETAAAKIDQEIQVADQIRTNAGRPDWATPKNMPKTGDGGGTDKPKGSITIGSGPDAITITPK